MTIRYRNQLLSYCVHLFFTAKPPVSTAHLPSSSRYLNLWPISLLFLASLPARSRPRTVGVRILYSPSLELVNENPASSRCGFGAWQELVLFAIKEL
jgi:hypothetical protein